MVLEWSRPFSGFSFLNFDVFCRFFKLTAQYGADFSRLLGRRIIGTLNKRSKFKSYEPAALLEKYPHYFANAPEFSEKSFDMGQNPIKFVQGIVIDNQLSLTFGGVLDFNTSTKPV